MNRLISAFVALVIALAVFSSVVFVVDQRQYAVVFAFGEIKQVIKEPGLHFKLPPPLQNVVFMDKRLQTIDVAGADRFITAEKKNLLVDWFVKWRVSDPRLFYVSFKGDNRLAQDSMTQKINSIARDEFARRTVSDVVSTDREAVMQSILKGVQEYGKSVGVDIIDVRLKRVDLLASVTESVYRRMEAERKRVANELRSTGAAEGEKSAPMLIVSAKLFWLMPTAMRRRSRVRAMPAPLTFMPKRSAAIRSSLHSGAPWKLIAHRSVIGRTCWCCSRTTISSNTCAARTAATPRRHRLPRPGAIASTMRR